MRIIARFEKRDSARFISHLDVQRLFQRAFRRADIPMAYSQGFNPHPQLSFATALTLGASSSAEWLELKLESDMKPKEFVERVNAALPGGFRLHSAMVWEDKNSLSALMESAEYGIELKQGCAGSSELAEGIDQLLSGPVMVMKKTKSGVKETDIRPDIRSIRIEGEDRLSVHGRLDAAGSLNIDLLMGALGGKLNRQLSYTTQRRAIYFAKGHGLPEA